ncbi:NACHT nucleoside triphosphatase, partial [Fusarium austroafricanum]
MASKSYDQVSEVFDNAKNDFLKGIKDPKVLGQLQNATTIDDVWDYTEQLQQDQANSKRLRGLKKISPYIERLQEYAAVIEVFVQAKPDVLAFIWGPIKLLLQISSNLIASFDAILGVMKDIGLVLPRFNEFIPLFKNNERMKYVLGLFFQDILDFYAVSLKFFTLTRWKVFFESLWPARRSEIQVIAKNIEKHRLLLCNEITLNDVLEAHTARQKALEHYAETHEFQENEKFHSMETYIRPPSYDEDLDRIRISRCEGTGSWLLQDEQFVSWLEGKKKAPQVLWLQGIPGA